ncbi:MAG: cell division control protein 6 [Euryarchaeota archaeon ADurb.Bin294]|nr:MAG: cell division control protein 6 [Euryarchaeota archaeon ADurb.Bin294]
MTNQREILQENNPFSSHTQPDPWVNQFPTISSINGDAFLTITRIISYKQTNPHDPVGILVKGEAGSGKTNMIARIREYCENTSFEVKFSTIRPIINYNTPIQHLFHGIITNLSHPLRDSFKFTQIHGILFSIISEYIDQKEEYRQAFQPFKDNPETFFRYFSDHDKERNILYNQVQTWIIDKIPDINRIFIKLIFAFGDPDLYHPARNRLLGEVADPEDAYLLNIPFKELSEAEAEDEASKFLKSLGLLLTHHHQCMIICFDQLENLYTPEHKRSFGLMNQMIFNESSAILPLAFMRTLYWEKFEEILDKSVIDRLGMNQVDLRGCSDEQITDIITSRIKTVFPDTWDMLADWLIPKVSLEFSSRGKYPSPREVIRIANKIIMMMDEKGRGVEIPIPSQDEVIRSAWMLEHDQILSDLDSWPPDYEQITNALQTYLQSRRIACTCKKESRKNILTINHSSKRCYIIINTNRNHSTIGAGFTKGIQFLQNNPGSSCLYLTDPRCIITKPKWIQTNQKREAFLAAGGQIMQPSEGEIARFYALYSLFCKITEGDIQIETKQGIRPITHDELSAYVGNKEAFPSLIPVIPAEFPGKVSTEIPLEERHEKDDPKKRELSDGAVHTAVCNILYSRPMHIMRADILVQSLQDNGISMTYDELIIWCGKHPAAYKILPNQQGSSIIATGKGPICSDSS